MSSPSKRREMDLMKLLIHIIFCFLVYAFVLIQVTVFFQLGVWVWLRILLLILGFFSSIVRMMSDYKVEMINDGMQEFYVHFHGPNESKFSFLLSLLLVLLLFVNCFGWKRVGGYSGYVVINPILTSVVLDLDFVGNIKILI